MSSMSVCDALAQWVEPVKLRYGDKPSRWQETTTRERLKFLFTDAHFEPIFGTTVDTLSKRQISSIHKSLRKARSGCKKQPYLQSIYPDIFLARVFNAGLPNTPFSYSFVSDYAIAQRGSDDSGSSANNAFSRATVQRVQRQLTTLGFKPGPADGSVGPMTSKAIVAFKESNGIKPNNGKLSASLIQRLDEILPSVAVVKPKPRPKPKPNPVETSPKPERSTTTASTARNSGLRAQEAANQPKQNYERIEGTPDQFVNDVGRLLAGSPVELTKFNVPFMGGLATGMLRTCKNVGTLSERMELAQFGVSTGVATAMGDNYSDRNIGRNMASGARSQSLTVAGEQVGNRVACSTRAPRVVQAMLKSLENNGRGSDGGLSNFVSSCTGAFSQTQCECLANTARPIMPDIHSQRYTRDVMPTITARNPLISMQVIMQCGIVKY